MEIRCCYNVYRQISVFFDASSNMLKVVESLKSITKHFTEHFLRYQIYQIDSFKYSNICATTYFFWEEAFPFFLSYLTGNYMYLLPSYICTYRYVRFIIKFFVCWTLVEHVIIFSEPLKIIFIFQCNILTGVESGAVTYLLIVI